jgi:hypothetical protein
LSDINCKAKVEYAILQNIQASVERGYQKGKPLHHLASAKSTKYNSKGSQFFVSSPEEFEKLAPAQVHDILRRRHILIPGKARDDVRFDRKGLASLGSLGMKRHIQGTSLN